MSESKDTRKLCKCLEMANALVFAVVGGTHQRPGWPDRYVAHREWSGWLEFKSAHGRLRTNQRITLRKLAERGVPALVARIDGSTLRLERWDGTVLGEANMAGIAAGKLGAKVLSALRLVTETASF